MKSRRMTWRYFYKVLVRKLEIKRPLGRPRRRWQYIKINLNEIGGNCGLDVSGLG
jgi:hypothetical protein